MSKDTTKRSHRPDDRLIALQAAQWLEALKTAGPREKHAFTDWLLESRRHVRNFLLMTAFDKELQKLDPESRHNVEALLAEPAGAVALMEFDGASFERRRNGRRSWRRWHWPVGLAAAVVVLALTALLTLFWNADSREYVTGVGEQRALKLPDSSLIHLNTRSRVAVRFSTEARDVRLVEGEALFVVAHDPVRPFRVTTGTAMIQAIGTQFNVYRRENATTVSVVEGRVQVSAVDTDAAAGASEGAHGGVHPSSRDQTEAATLSLQVPSLPTPLAAGEEATVAGDGAVVKRAAPDPTTAVAWRERRLVFHDDTLTDVAAEFNRYNATKIRIEGDGIRQRRFTGVLDADKPESLLRLLATEHDLNFQRQEDEFVIRSR